MVNGLRKKLKDSIESFNNLWQQISLDYWEIVQRWYFTVTGKNPNDKTIDLLISTGHLLFSTLFKFSVEIFRRFHWEFSKGFMCCLAWIFACFSWIFVRIFRRFHWEFSKGFMCVVWLGFLLFFFFFWFLLVLKEIFIGGVVDAGDQIMGFTMAKVPLQIKF